MRLAVEAGRAGESALALPATPPPVIRLAAFGAPRSGDTGSTQVYYRLNLTVGFREKGSLSP